MKKPGKGLLLFGDSDDDDEDDDEEAKGTPEDAAKEMLEAIESKDASSLAEAVEALFHLVKP